MSRLHRPKAGFWIRLCVVILYPLDALLFKLRWRGLERVPGPDSGGVILAVNHLSPADTALMARAVWQSGRIPRFLIKAGVFEWPVIGRIMSGAGQIPVHRGTTDASKSLHEAAVALERGEAIVIYPEGTTTKDPDNWPMQAKTGIARLIMLSPETPVVPIGQWGVQKIRPFNLERVGRRRTSHVSVGEPLDFSRYRDEVASQTLLRRITDEVMTAVRDEVASARGETPPDRFFAPTRRYVDKRAR